MKPPSFRRSTTFAVSFTSEMPGSWAWATPIHTRASSAAKRIDARSTGRLAPASSAEETLTVSIPDCSPMSASSPAMAPWSRQSSVNDRNAARNASKDVPHVVTFEALPGRGLLWCHYRVQEIELFSEME